MPTRYQMQAKSSADGKLYSWRGNLPDRTGTGYTGPGTPLDVALYSSPVTSFSQSTIGVVAVKSPTPKPAVAGVFYTFSPASIAGLALWLDGRQTMYSDSSGTTPAVKPSGRVRRINQPSPLSGSWLAGSDPVRPFREANAIDLQYAGGLTLAQPSGVTVPAAASTFFFAAQSRANGSGVSGANVLCFGFDGTGNVGVQFGSGKVFVHHAGAIWDTLVAVPPGAFVAGIVRFDGTGINIKVNVNGAVSTASLVVALSGTISAQNIGLGAALNGQMALAQYGCVSNAVSDADRDSLLSFCQANMAGDFPTDAPLLEIMGDSIAAGFGAAQSTAWAYLLQKNLNGSLTVPARLLNTAIQGYTLANMATDYPTVVKPRYSASRTKNVVIVAGATNSMTDAQGFPAAQILTAIYAICDTARADGYKVVLCTVLPRSDAGAGAGFNAKRATVNADIRANWASHADALADVAGISGMGADGDSDNTTYYVDKLHPNGNGSTTMEPTIRTAVLTILP